MKKASPPRARGGGAQILHRAAGEVDPAARRETEGAFAAELIRGSVERYKAQGEA